MSSNTSMDHISPNMSTMSLENRLRQLKEESQKLDHVLTQKLASSQSGQNLLHIGTSLSSLPPDLHLLLQQLHPVLSQAELSEKEQLQQLEQLVQAVRDIKLAERRVQHSQECSDLYQDLIAAEQSVQNKEQVGMRGCRQLMKDSMIASDEAEDALDYASSLERAAHIALCLVEELHAATETVSALTSGKRTTAESNDSVMPSLMIPLPEDSERAQFIMKLAPRIRRLEVETTKALSSALEDILQQIRINRQGDSMDSNGSGHEKDEETREETLLLMIGHVMRGLALLGRGKEVESIFARVAIMPLVRPLISMGRLDEGGSRGECAGLPSLLQEVVDSIAAYYGPVLCLSESMFECNESGEMLDVDLLTAGVWAPIATALMADAGIKMAIFSPGIASILQINYITLDGFLSRLAVRLLKDDARTAPKSNGSSFVYQPAISDAKKQLAQERIYSHPKTAEFSKRWNLPIYYQLRFGECCSRLNKAIESTQREGWVAEVFSGPVERAVKIKNEAGFEISLFIELYDILYGMWRSDVILAPLTNRFLRGAMQLIGRVLSFAEEGMRGKVQFGEEARLSDTNGALENGGDTNGAGHKPYARTPYCWGESEVDVAAVAWELTILESALRYDYGTVICDALKPATALAERAEIRGIVDEFLSEVADQMHPLVHMAWDDIIVRLLTSKCSQPLAAVKGVAATYRMTNRPPPTQASPFVATILRPMKIFSGEFDSRTPDRIGSKWKHQIVVTIADLYATAVEELITTVQRTEEALNSRRTRRTSTGGMRDGEKVKLQVYLDYEMFTQCVREVGVDPATVIGISKLKELTAEGQELQKRDEPT